MQQIKQLLAREIDQLDKLIVNELHSDVGLVENIGHYIVEAGGKRLRPILTLLAARACNTANNKHIDMACVVEFIHTATLLHDDVVDMSSLRRGRETANELWGNAPSVLVGDFIYSRAFQMMVRNNDMAIMQLMADTTNLIAEGEVLQLVRAGDAATNEAQYNEVIFRKTAVLFAAAAQAGVICASGDGKTQQAFYQFGKNLGLAFQIIDDVLDYTGDSETMGKNVGDDLAEGKPTLPLIYLIKHQAESAAMVTEAIRNKSAEQLPAIIKAVQESGAIDYCYQQAGHYAELAKQSVDFLTDSEIKQALLRLTEIACQRKQ